MRDLEEFQERVSSLTETIADAIKEELSPSAVADEEVIEKIEQLAEVAVQHYLDENADEDKDSEPVEYFGNMDAFGGDLDD